MPEVRASPPPTVPTQPSQLTHHLVLHAGARVSQVLTQTFQAGGISGLWEGLGVTLGRDVPYLIIKWCVYAQAKALLESTFGGLLSAPNLVAGAIAGAVAATAVTPADVIKTRLQVRGDQRSALRVANSLIAEGGIPALFRGLGPRLARIPIYTAITLATFDAIKDFFEESNGLIMKTV